MQDVGRAPSGKKIAAEKAGFAVTYPEVAGVGLTEDQAKSQGIKVKNSLFPRSASGRAIANCRDEGATKLLFDGSPTHKANQHLATLWQADVDVYPLPSV